MHSPAEGAVGLRARLVDAGWRPWLELALRLVAFGMLILLIVRTLLPDDRTRVERAGGEQVRAALERWSGDPSLVNGHLSFTELPPASTRAWMQALRAAGVGVGYDAPEWPALALGVASVADPVGGVRVLVAAPAGSEVAVSDAVGALDTLHARGAGGMLETAALASPARAVLPGVTAGAVAPPPVSLALRQVLVIGRAGWETKFTVAALEERGWSVVSRMAVAPDVDVTRGQATPIDTARLAAVVALDGSAAALAPAIARYVRSGGGLVLGAEAAALPALARVAAGRPGGALPGASRELGGPTPRAGLPLQPIVSLVDDALVLEHRGDAAVVVARRVGAGRLVQLGYEESWRWRMGGAEGAPEAHRRWWSELVASVAYARPVTGEPVVVVAGGEGDVAGAGAGPAGVPDGGAAGEGSRRDDLDGAPVAGLIDEVGEPSLPPPDRLARSGAARTPWWALAAIVAALVVEWTSRRLRGAR